MDVNNTGVKPNDAQEESILSRMDIDPVEDVCQLLANAGHPNPLAWLDNIHPDALNKEIDPDVRRFLVNRQWHQILGLVDEDTTKARYCLVDKGPLNVWLVLFKQTVVPLAVRLQLPNEKFF